MVQVLNLNSRKSSCSVHVLYAFLHRAVKSHFPLLDTSPGAILPFENGFFAERKVRTGEEIPVMITASEERLGAAVAAMNSINRNSKANVVFSVVTLNESVEHLR